MSQKREHSLVPIAQWKPRGNPKPGEMRGCTLCGMVVIDDRRGTMLIHGGVGALHKHLSPTQAVPSCPGSQAGVMDSLNGIARELAAKQDPRFEMLHRPDAPR
ncbi:MAG: hypothetical protein ACREQ4_00475 [Candidatus Binataceae bacterium]